VLTSTVSNYAGQVINLGILFLLTPLIVKQLGATAYGLWMLVGSLMAYGALLDLGIWGALIKYVAEYRIRGAYAEANGLIATALWLYCGLGLSLFGLATLAAPFFPTWFGITGEQANTARALVLLMGFSAGLALPGMAPLAILRGLQRYAIVNLLEVAGTIFTAVATVAVLYGGGGVLGLVAVNACGVLALAAPTVWLIQRLDPQLRIGWRGGNWQYVRQLFGYSWPLLLSDTALRLQTKTDEIVIGALLVVSAVTPYSLARKLSDVTLLLTKQLVKVFVPMASELAAQADRERLRTLYLTGSHLTVALAAPLAVGIALLARPLLWQWVGTDFVEAAPVVAILSAAGFLAAAQWPAVAVLRGMNHHRPLAAAALGAGLLNLGLSLAWAGRWGLVGVAWGTLAPAFLEFVFVLLYAVRRLDIGVGGAAGRIFAPVLLPLALMVCALWAGRQLWPEQTLLGLGGSGGLGLLTYGIFYLIIGLPAPERQLYRATVQSSLRAVIQR
jgi:O-antigen/teichoic acid export membrane protein